MYKTSMPKESKTSERKNALSKRETEVYVFIKDFINKKQYSPSFREILKNTEYKSTDSIHCAIKKLNRLNYIKIDKDENGNVISRSIRIIK